MEQKGLKNETREAEGMGLLQWQRKWGGSPDEGTVSSVLVWICMGGMDGTASTGYHSHTTVYYTSRIGYFLYSPLIFTAMILNMRPEVYSPYLNSSILLVYGV